MRRICLTVLLAVAGCTTTVTPPPPDSTSLSDRLLSESDVPKSYHRTQPPPKDPFQSDHPDCANTMQSLEIDTPGPPVTEARVLFTAEDGAAIQHVVRQYPAGAASTTLRAAADTLAKCRTFTLRYQDGMVINDSLTPRSSSDTVLSADVVADTGAFILHSRLTVLRSGDRLAIVSVNAPDKVDDGLVQSAVTTAQAKLG